MDSKIKKALKVANTAIASKRGVVKAIQIVKSTKARFSKRDIHPPELEDVLQQLIKIHGNKNGG